MDLENSRIDTAHSEHELLLNDPGSAKKKARADKRRRRKYKFTDKKHSRSGIAATVMIVPEIALIAYAVVLAVRQKGLGGELVGWLPFIALVMATVGIVLSGIGFRKTDAIYTFSWIGLIASIVVWLFVAVMMVIGL